MAATFLATAIASVVAGVLLHSVSPRWIWGGSAVLFVVAAGVGYSLARVSEDVGPAVEPAH
jgi:hypothetical protein